MEQITPAGREKLKKELEELLETERPALAKRLKKAISFGDLSENAEYADAKDEQRRIEGRIGEIRHTLRNAKVVQDHGKDQTAIHVGSVFTVTSDAEGGSKTFTIVGKEESRPLEGKISFDSPLGAAFLGKGAGEEVSVQTPKGTKKFLIGKILS